MTTTHTVFNFVGGDDWEINAKLLDENDDPYDLTNAIIKWTLIDKAGHHVLEDDDIALAIIDALGGVCSIMVPSTKTTEIATGRYTDALRIITGGITSTLSIGPVQVITDPWRVTEPVTQHVVTTFRRSRAA
jgi:hypothetical protein